MGILFSELTEPAGCKASDPPRAAQCVAQTFKKLQKKQKELLKVKTHPCHLSKWLYILLLPRRSSSLAARHTGTPREGPWPELKLIILPTHENPG